MTSNIDSKYEGKVFTLVPTSSAYCLTSARASDTELAPEHLAGDLLSDNSLGESRLEV